MIDDITSDDAPVLEDYFTGQDIPEGRAEDITFCRSDGETEEVTIYDDHSFPLAVTIRGRTHTYCQCENGGCENYASSADMESDVAGNQVCRACAQGGDYARCHGCEVLVARGDERQSPSADRHGNRNEYCDTCWGERWCECEGCSATISHDESWTHYGDSLCHECYTGRDTCGSGCDCPECAMFSNDRYHRGERHPTFFDFHEDWASPRSRTPTGSPTAYGVEIEMEVTRSRRGRMSEVSKEFIRSMSDAVHEFQLKTKKSAEINKNLDVAEAKPDGSLTSKYGLEIPTIPLRIETWRHVLRDEAVVRAFNRWADQEVMTNDREIGLHISISDRCLTPLGRYRVASVFAWLDGRDYRVPSCSTPEQHNRFIRRNLPDRGPRTRSRRERYSQMLTMRLLGRRPSDYSMNCAPDPMAKAKDRNPNKNSAVAIRALAKTGRGANRIEREGRIEIRAIRSHYNPARILERIELLDDMIRWACGPVPVELTRHQLFVNFLKFHCQERRKRRDTMAKEASTDPKPPSRRAARKDKYKAKKSAKALAQ